MAEPSLESLSPTRRSILLLLKREREVTVRQVSAELSISYEAARQQMSLLQQEGWISGRHRRDGAGGRPSVFYGLTRDGDQLFPKSYDELGIELIDGVISELGIEALRKILVRATEARVRKWRPLLEGLPLEKRLEALRSFYFEDDPYMQVEEDERGLRLVEHNCPLLNMALARPHLCAVTVASLQRTLGVEVVREETFQRGNGRCVFRPRVERPINPDACSFKFEEEE